MAKKPVKPATKKPAKKTSPPKKKAPKKTSSQDTSVYILLDRSGSMTTMWDEALKSINLYVKKLDGPTNVVLATFDSESYDVLRDTKVDSWRTVSIADALPRAMTPLYDACGKLLDRMFDDDPESGVLVVMTDGYENSSKEYTKETIESRLASAKTDKGWQVVFLGANFRDITSVSTSLGIAPSQSLNITGGNMGDTMAVLASYTRAYTTTKSNISFTDSDVKLATRPKK